MCTLYQVRKHVPGVYMQHVHDKPCLRQLSNQGGGNTFDTKSCRNRREPYETVTDGTVPKALYGAVGCGFQKAIVKPTV